MCYDTPKQILVGGDNVSNKNEVQSKIGEIIDLPLKDFERELIVQKVNIGTINNLILLLEATYNNLKCAKEAVLDLVFKGIKKKDDPEVKKAVDGLYAEMIKAEQKITYLKQRSKDLVNVDKNTIN